MFRLIKTFLGAGLLLTLLLACNKTGSSTATKGNYKEAIETRLLSYFNLTNNSEWNEMLDMVYPKVFVRIPRQDMLNQFQGMEQSGMFLQTDNVKVQKVSEVFTVNEEDFVFVDYYSDLTMSLQGERFQDPAVQARFIEELGKFYGFENVTKNADGTEIYVKANRVIFAVSEAGKNDWKFVENNTPDMTILEGILPTEIIEKYEGSVE